MHITMDANTVEVVKIVVAGLGALAFWWFFFKS